MRLTVFLVIVLVSGLAVCSARAESAYAPQEVILQGSLGDIHGMYSFPEGMERAPLVILSHGFGGTYQGNEAYAEAFHEAGFATYNFDFCGGSPFSSSGGSMLDMTVLTEAQDLSGVIGYFSALKEIDGIYLWGASQGGFVSAYTAALYPDIIRAMVLEFPAFVLQDDAAARAGKDGTFPETSLVMGMTIGRNYNLDAVSFDIYEVLPRYTGDVLILHGDRDMVVPLRYSEKAAEEYAHAELIVMPGQNHGFMGAARREAMERETAFFLSHVNPYKEIK